MFHSRGCPQLSCSAFTYWLNMEARREPTEQDCRDRAAWLLDKLGPGGRAAIAPLAAKYAAMVGRVQLPGPNDFPGLRP